MANYSYESSSYSSGGGAGGGAGGANALFNQADANSDGSVSFGEFSNFVGKLFNWDVCVC